MNFWMSVAELRKERENLQYLDPKLLKDDTVSVENSGKKVKDKLLKIVLAQFIAAFNTNTSVHTFQRNSRIKSKPE